MFGMDCLLSDKTPPRGSHIIEGKSLIPILLALLFAIVIVDFKSKAQALSAGDAANAYANTILDLEKHTTESSSGNHSSEPTRQRFTLPSSILC